MLGRASACSKRVPVTLTTAKGREAPEAALRRLRAPAAAAAAGAAAAASATAADEAAAARANALHTNAVPKRKHLILCSLFDSEVFLDGGHDLYVAARGGDASHETPDALACSSSSSGGSSSSKSSSELVQPVY
ncbi:hypothetical protein ACSSS7_006992 [Eimeria intestinalis]